MQGGDSKPTRPRGPVKGKEPVWGGDPLEALCSTLPMGHIGSVGVPCATAPFSGLTLCDCFLHLSPSCRARDPSAGIVQLQLSSVAVTDISEGSLPPAHDEGLGL